MVKSENEKKRIMLIVPMLHQGGYERMCALTAKLLNDRHEVYLVIFNSKDKFYDVSGVELIDLDLGAVKGKIGKLINIVKRVKSLKKLKKQLDIQITYSFGTTANIANVLSKTKDITWAGIRAYAALEEHPQMDTICKKADKVISCAKVMEEDILNQYKVKSSATLYNPCNLEEIAVLAKEDVSEKFQVFFDKPGKTIVSMGREDDVKGFWHLIKSVYLVKKIIMHFANDPTGNLIISNMLRVNDNLNIKLMIIGDGSFDEYKKLVKALDMEEDVIFTGVQKNPFALLARADIYALTSDSEGFPNALIEAMSLGLPCISVNCKTGPAEILNEEYKACSDRDKVYYADYGVLMPVFKGEKNLAPEYFTKEEKIFADEIAKMITKEEMLEQYGIKAKKRAWEFSQGAYKNALEQLM